MARDPNDLAQTFGVDVVREKFDRAEIREPTDDRPPIFSDEALALRFADRHADDLRYVAAWARWLIYDGSRWAFDETLRAFDLSRQVCRTAAAECNKPRTATTIASAKTVAAILNLARADRRIAASVDQWDADPWSLATPSAAIDLRTGDARPHRAADYFTRITAVSPGGSCPTWRAFLDRITAGDTSLAQFIQRVAGYALTGATSAHALFFAYGTGGNGKGVLINTVAGILGDYHRTAPIETFTASNVTQHPTDLAGLRGARLVTATETEEGRRWAEARIKALTGGDEISARFMRQDFFQYRPQFKLVISGNHRPGLRSVDEAIRRRFHLIPFAVTIPLAERDETLTERLKAEWPGILAWMLEGCAEWQARGLDPPAAVTAATASYLDSQDAITAWMEECVTVNVVDPKAWTSSKLLFESWSKWAMGNGEFAGSRPRFLDALESRGVDKQRRGDVHGFRGLKIVPKHDPTPV